MKKYTTQSGQTLITLLMFMVIATTITAAAVVIIISGSTSASRFQQGVIATRIAESAGENALLRLLRSPSYTGESMTIDGGSAIITVTGTTTKVINVTSTYGNFKRKIRINAGYTAGMLVITPPWKEIYP